MRMRFFSDRKIPFETREKVSLAVWGIATAGLLLPTCLELAPKGNDKNNAGNDLDQAKDKNNQAVKQFNTAVAKYREAKQRVTDLFCAMDGYQSFNDRVNAFIQSVSATPLADQLRLNWNINFAADTTKVQRSIVAKSKDYTEWVYGSYTSCSSSSCGKNQNCCTVMGYHYTTKTYYYNEITEITQLLENIGQGTGAGVLPLDCGYYSRELAAFAPQSYVTSQSPVVNSGDPRSGTTYVTYTQYIGSQVPEHFLLDDTLTNTMAIIPRDQSQAAAGNTLATSLYRFLIASFATFNLTGIDYPALQQRINNTLPALADGISQANATVQETALVLAQKQEIYDQAEDEFKDGLSLWLPLFFLAPAGLAMLTYLFMTYYKSIPGFTKNTTVAENAPAAEVELEEVRATAQP